MKKIETNSLIKIIIITKPLRYSHRRLVFFFNIQPKPFNVVPSWLKARGPPPPLWIGVLVVVHPKTLDLEKGNGGFPFGFFLTF